MCQQKSRRRQRQNARAQKKRHFICTSLMYLKALGYAHQVPVHGSKIFYWPWWYRCGWSVSKNFRNCEEEYHTPFLPCCIPGLFFRDVRAPCTTSSSVYVHGASVPILRWMLERFPRNLKAGSNFEDSGTAAPWTDDTATPHVGDTNTPEKRPGMHQKLKSNLSVRIDPIRTYNRAEKNNKTNSNLLKFITQRFKVSSVPRLGQKGCMIFLVSFRGSF